MGMLSGFPYFEIEFDKDGETSNPDEVNALKAALQPGDPTDLIVFSHGWNSDMADARRMYERFFASFRTRLDAGVPGTQDRKFAILAVLWPSMKFADEDLIPSGAAGLGSLIPDGFITSQLDNLKGFFTSALADAALEKAKALVPKLENSPAAQKDFADLIRSTIAPEASQAKDGAEEVSPDFFTLAGDVVMQRLSKPVPIAAPASLGGSAGVGGAASGPGMGGNLHGTGGAAGIGSFFAGIKAAATNLLNLTTYYQMKARAGLVGAHGLAPLLRSIKTLHTPLKVHLAGHSFGCRLITSAVSTLDKTDSDPAIPVDSLSLLQGAFSHYGFSDKWDGTHPGAFRNVLADRQVKGAMLATHTVNDKAVGLAYPLASLLAGQVAAGLGDKNDKYGGLGRNGAQMTPEAVEGRLLAAGSPYEFTAGKIHNLLADDYVKGHSDICGEEVAYAVLANISRT
jgi:hypothetical protein